MSIRTSLTRTAAFAAVYVLATVAGRLTVMDGTNLSMVWPAAGVLVVWFCAQREARCRWADYTALVAITLVVNMATGATARMAVVFVVANVAQIVLFLHLFRRWQPTLWGAGGHAPLSRLRDLWSLLGAAAASTALGAALGTTGMWLVTGHYSWPAAAVWLARNTASILLIGAVGISLGYQVRPNGINRTPGPLLRRALAAVRRTPRRRAAEYTALLACSVTAYSLGFAFNHGLPVSFALIAVSVWAGLRTPTGFVVVHDLAIGAAAVLFTLHGSGPFATVADDAERACIAQLFVAVVAVIGLALALSRDERTALLDALEAERAELARQQQAAQRQADLMTAIVDAMADGVSVIDASGQVRIRNEASLRILGGHIADDNRLASTSHYGLFNLDGTPLADHETAYAEVLRDGGVVRRELLVRNPNVPDGRIVSVTASRLAGEDGEPCAVLVFHDITAERRHRSELASFAGVVAHDLQNPLTAVQGWTEAAVDTLDAAADSRAVRAAQDQLLRARRAADRMRTLITDLLAYTTTRDATINPTAIDLDALVTDIAVARTDAAVAAGAPTPRFRIATLGPVHADPTLVRQLLDNLIGNAVKYTPPGTEADITITGQPLDSGHVEITVADRGIGIPSGQHDAVFATFHRAHAGDGYTGTGLGLAICQRIVHRHGGTIHAQDNPAGGTQFHFTLPTAAQTSQNLLQPVPSAAAAPGLA